MALVDPYDAGGHDVEREAMLFAVLRERVRPAQSSTAQADEEISEWLDEAEQEGARILQQARAEAARERTSFRVQVRSLRHDLAALLDRADALLHELEEDEQPPRLVLLPGGEAPAKRSLRRLLRRRS